MSSAVFLTHTQPEQTSAAVEAAAAAAREAGWTLLAGAEERAKHGPAAAACEPLENAAEEPSLCLVLGGDGTILKALRRYADTDVPVFGVNFGTVGFLATVDRDELGEGLRRAFAREYELMRLPALEVAGAAIEAPRALNDVALMRRPHGRVAELSYRLGGQEVGHVRCDGLVAATPAGSTGYNLANQGPILAWGVKGYVVSFIAPHTLTARPLVAAPGDVLSVTNAAGRESVDVVLDGDHVGALASGDEMTVAFRDGVSTLAQIPGANFYQRIREKFGRLAH